MDDLSKQTTEKPKATLTALQEQIDTLNNERAELLDLVKALSEAITGEDAEVEREVETLVDPYAEDAPLRIDGGIPADPNFPEGQVLKWLNAEARERQGRWRGWRVMQWGDQYTGKPEDGKLREYGMPDPPAMMVSGTKMDSAVRRGDLVLGRLDAKIYKARCALSIQRANANRAAASQFTTTIHHPGAALVGAGLQDDPNTRAIGMDRDPRSMRSSKVSDILAKLKDRENG